MSEKDAELLDAPALSVKQPWAELILLGRKRLELRTWSTPYRGPVWLHTGGSPDGRAIAHFRMPKLFSGGYVGLVHLEDVVPLNSSRWEEWRYLHLDPGRDKLGLLGFLLTRPRRLANPIAARGALKLFNVPAETAVALVRRLVQ
jgi:hypothetical protein